MAFPLKVVYLLLFFLVQVCLVTVHELVHTTGGIHKLHLTCIERVRGAGNLQFDQRVFISVLHFDSLSGSCS